MASTLASQACGFNRRVGSKARLQHPKLEGTVRLFASLRGANAYWRYFNWRLDRAAVHDQAWQPFGCLNTDPRLLMVHTSLSGTS